VDDGPADTHSRPGSVKPDVDTGTQAGRSPLVAEWSTGVVEAVALTRSGSTYVGTVTRFLTCLQNPVAVVLSPDGALLVGDWTSGTIYRIAST
jgi:hypothetical protein